jgi:hypothetical protein
MCIFVSLFVYLFIYVCIYVCIFDMLICSFSGGLRNCSGGFTYEYVCILRREVYIMYVYIYIFLYIYVYTCICIYVNICTYFYVCIYLHKSIYIIFQVLLAHNADPTFKNELNETAYSLAVASGRYYRRITLCHMYLFL